MRQVAIAVLQCMLVALPAAAAPVGGLPASVPDVIPTPSGTGLSLWVSARAASDPETVIKWDLFGEVSPHDSLHSAIDLENKRAAHPKDGMSPEVAEIPEADCPSHTISSSFSQAPDPALSFPQLIARSPQGIYSGTVTAVTPGFVQEVPAELITIHLDAVIVPAASPQQVPSQIHLFYGVAHFRIGSYYFCGLSGDGRGDPAVGKRILIFADESEQPGTGRFNALPENQLIYETATGLHIPPALQRHAGDSTKISTFDDALAVIRKATAGAKP